jgi:PIN domain nuclease of toxin-antitoxin system
MILLLDSHALVWWLLGGDELSEPARRSIADQANDTIVSAATVWELAIKRAAGKLKLAAEISADVEAAGFHGLPITLADVESAASLPRHHNDPFDRMLIAQAQRVDAIVVTRDRAFGDYDVKVLPA